MAMCLALRGVPFSMEGYEADDLLGTIAKRSEAKGMDVTVLPEIGRSRAGYRLSTRIPKIKGGKTT